MKIQKIKIDGYKSLKGIEIGQLSKINMLYGYNNSGKSNVLRILELIFKRKQDPNSNVFVDGTSREDVGDIGGFSEGIIPNSTFLFNLRDEKPKVEFEVIVELELKEYESILKDDYQAFAEAYFVGNSHNVIPTIITGQITPLDNLTASFQVTSALVNRNSVLEVDEKGEKNYLKFLSTATPANPLSTKGYELVTNFLAYFDDAVVLLDNDRYFQKELEYDGNISLNDFDTKTFKRWLYKQYLDPTGYNTFKEVVEFVKLFKVHTDAKNLSLKACEANSPLGNLTIGFSKNDEEEINIMLNSGDKRLPLDSFGTGIQQILFILSKIFVAKAKIVLIEELELNLSPRYQGELLKHLNKLLASKFSQVFFTTHSKYFNFRNDFSIYELSLGDDGNSKCQKVDSPRNSFFLTRSLD